MLTPNREPMKTQWQDEPPELSGAEDASRDAECILLGFSAWLGNGRDGTLASYLQRYLGNWTVNRVRVLSENLEDEASKHSKLTTREKRALKLVIPPECVEQYAEDCGWEQASVGYDENDCIHIGRKVGEVCKCGCPVELFRECAAQFISDYNHDSLPIQTYYDYPGLAGTFGWSIKTVQHDSKV